MLLTRYKVYWELMRFHRPVGIWLLLWPTLWGLWIAAKGFPPLFILMIFIAGTILMRAAGCVINDIADRKFDLYVARTKDRPLTSGKVSLREAYLLFFTLLLLAFGLVLLLNTFAIFLSFIGAFLAVIYPFMKRWMQAPQLILGLAFAWGIPMAFAAVTESLPWDCWYLFIITVLWAVMYDTLYAMVDREDDVQIGIKSTAVWFGRFDKFIIGLLQFVIVVMLSRYLSGFFLFLVFLLFCYQQYLIRHRLPEYCFKAFLNNQWVGVVVFLGVF